MTAMVLSKAREASKFQSSGTKKGSGNPKAILCAYTDLERRLSVLPESGPLPICLCPWAEHADFTV